MDGADQRRSHRSGRFFALLTLFTAPSTRTVYLGPK